MRYKIRQLLLLIMSVLYNLVNAISFSVNEYEFPKDCHGVGKG